MAIIIGFPCIGKSTLTRSERGKKELGLIDLESSCFNDPRDNYDTKIPRWAEGYVATAHDLSNQGYNVFVSSHSDVLYYIFNFDVRPIIIVPSVKLKELWVKRASERLAADQSKKNFKALNRIFNNFAEDVTNLIEAKKKYGCDIEPIICRIDNPDYDLFDVVNDALVEYHIGNRPGK